MCETVWAANVWIWLSVPMAVPHWKLHENPWLVHNSAKHFENFITNAMLWVEYVQEGLILYRHAAANACGEKPGCTSDSSLNVMDSTPLPCDVHAHLISKWPIHGTIVFQSCQGKVQNSAHSAAWCYYCATVYSPSIQPALKIILNTLLMQFCLKILDCIHVLQSIQKGDNQLLGHCHSFKSVTERVSVGKRGLD